MRESFGVRLRQERERRGIDLATIAERTKIKQSLLQELERDDVSHWPTGIFRRAFIRAYAKAIGMDQELAVREFLEQYPDPVEAVEPAASENGISEAPEGSSPPTRFRCFVGSILARFRNDGAETNGHAAELIARAYVPAPDPPVAAAPLPPETPSAPAPAPPVAPLLEPEPLPAAATPGPDLDEVARLCTYFGQLDDVGQVAPLVEEAARLLEAVGLIVWVWDAKANELMPILTHGYSDYVLALVPKVRRESDNATAAAFRSAQTCIVASSEHASGAMVVPLMAPVGCIGVLAIELRNGSERLPSVRSLATILAAQLARLIDAARPLETADRRVS